MTYKQQEFICHSFGDWKFKIMIVADFTVVAGKDLLSGS